MSFCIQIKLLFHILLNKISPSNEFSEKKVLTPFKMRSDPQENSVQERERLWWDHKDFHFYSLFSWSHLVLMKINTISENFWNQSWSQNSEFFVSSLMLKFTIKSAPRIYASSQYLLRSIDEYRRG